MALVDNGLKVSLDSGQVPAGASTQSVTEFTDHEYVREEVFNVAKSTVEDASKATTFDNILNDTSVGVKKQVTDLLTADYIGTNTVTYFSEITYITSNIAGNNAASDFYSNAAINYVCIVKIYIKTA